MKITRFSPTLGPALLAMLLPITVACAQPPGEDGLGLPPQATITNLVSGDLACYVDLRDEDGQEYLGVYAVFDICEQEDLIGQKVGLVYQPEQFNDCESAEPCGKTKTQLAIAEVRLTP